jgi:GH25 family lysozyme M1 (1,4-beta-N-acetylmuramidase)
VLTFTLERHQAVVDALNGQQRARGARTFLAAPAALTFGIDVSHWQGPIDWRAVATAGFRFVVIKATEGTGFVDSRMREYRAGARKAGLIVLLYHYVGSSSARRVFDATAEAEFFAATVGPLAKGEGVAEDYEPLAPPPDPAGWSRTFLERVRTRLGVPRPWIYLNSTAERTVDWTAAGVAPAFPLWLAKYDNDPDMDAAVHWPRLAAEQYWDKATVPGVPGPVDVDVFYGTVTELLAHCAGGGAPEEDEMSAEAEQRIAAIYGWLKGEKNEHNPEGHDNIYQIWEMLKGGNPPGQDNFYWTVATLGGQLAALQSVVAALAQTPGGLSADEIAAAAKAGADQALAALADRIRPDGPPTG